MTSHPTTGRPRRSLDPRHPLVLDTRELGRRPGSMRQVRRSLAAPPHLHVELAEVPEGSQLWLQLRLEAVLEGVLVSGTVTTAFVGECARCLDPVRDDLVADVQELFSYPEAHVARHAPRAAGRGGPAPTVPDDEAAEEGPRLDGELLDLEPVLRDAVVLALPLRPLCRPDCAGLCPDCGLRLDAAPGHRHDARDPRWAALTGLPVRPDTDPTDPHPDSKER